MITPKFIQQVIIHYPKKKKKKGVDRSDMAKMWVGKKTNSKAHSKGRDICAMCLARKTSENEAKEMVCIGRANPPHQVLWTPHLWNPSQAQD